MRKQTAKSQTGSNTSFDCEKELDIINRNKPSIIKTEIQRISQLGKVMSLRQIYNEVDLDNKPDYSEMSALLKFTLRRMGFSRDLNNRYFAEGEITRKLNELFPTTDTHKNAQQ